MKLNRKRLWLTLAGLALVVVIVRACRPPPVGVDVARVTRGPLQVTVDEDGKTRIKERYTVSAPLAGRLVRIALKAGDPVAAGRTLVAAIEPSDPSLLDARARAEAEARVKAAEAARHRAVPNLERARSNHTFAQTEWNRTKELAASGAVSPQELDDAELKARMAAEELRAAEYAVQIAEFELQQARAVLLRADPADGGDAGRFEIRSPVGGRVLRVFQESTTVVSPGTHLVELGDPRDLEVEVDVLSADGVRITPGDKVWFEHWGGTNALLGRVRLVEPAAFTKISALGVEEQRVWVICDFVDPLAQRQALGDAYRVEARIVIWENDEVLKVAAGALFRAGDDWAVFLARGGRASLQRVRIRHNNGLAAEVLDGLTEDDVVILHPSDQIHDGARIQRR